MAKDRYVLVQIIRVRYGHSPEYGEALEMLNAGLEKTKCRKTAWPGERSRLNGHSR